MKKLSVLGIVVGAALLSVMPLSIHPSATRLVELSFNNAEAGYAGYRKHHRRTYQHSYYRYGWSDYYVYKYPDGYPVSYYGYGYSAYSAGYAPLGINWDNWGGWGGM
jgi:hypothetical protein